MRALCEGLKWHKRSSFLLISEEMKLIAVDKQVGVLSHPNGSHDESKSVLRSPYNPTTEAYRVASNPLEDIHAKRSSMTDSLSHIHLLHRLDKSTSGVLLLSSSNATATYMKNLFRQRQVRKQYLAVVFSHRPPVGKQRKGEATEVWTDSYRFRQDSGPSTAHTEVTLLHHDRTRGLAYLLLEPRTGFTHQLRIQCALRGCPIVGDDIHGDFATNKQHFQSAAPATKVEHIMQQQQMPPRQAPISALSLPSPSDKRLYLHAYSLRFDFAFNGYKQHVHITAPPPAGFLSPIVKDFA